MAVKENREKNFAKNTFIISLGTVLPKFTSFITLPILTGRLTTAEYGTHDLITTLVSLFLPMVTLQIQSAAFRFLIDRRNDKKEVDRVITNIIAYIVPVSLAALVILFFVLQNLTAEIRFLICVYFFVDILLKAAQQIVRGLSNNKLYSASSILHSILNMLFLILFVSVADRGLEGVLAASTLSIVAGILLLTIRSGMLKHIHISLVSGSLLKEMLSYSWPLVPNSLSLWALKMSDRLVITFFLGVEANAMYSVANKIPSLLNTLQSTFSLAWQENASLAVKDNDSSAYYTHMFDEMFCILSGVTALLIAATPILFWLLINSKYNDAYVQMPILFLGMLFSCLSSFMGGIYIAHKKTKSVGIMTVVAAGINLLIDLLLVNVVGIFAGSISTLAAYLFLTIERMIGATRLEDIHYNIKKILLLLAVLCLMSGLCWINTLPGNILNIVIGTVFTCATNWQIVKLLFQMIRKKVFRKEA
ncbi:MAG: oligosaccharide flippase family protein [Lachnospiraceae bacterium]|nr:oligosaccharide flippase family protein [Lachnospiraceae bacterium]